MVYCGKPSKACLECRVRRRRCDMTKPSCGQCLRAGAECTGFRDVHSLRFRNQSAQVIRKANTAQASDSPVATVRKHQPGSDTSDERQQGLIHSWVQQSMHKLYATPSLPCRDQQPLQFFIHHYISEYAALSYGRRSSFQSIYSQAPAHGYLSNVVQAVGMASLANLHHSPHFRQAAFKRYSSVLRGIRLALTEPNHTVSEQLLVTVMLLNLFEIVTCDGINLSSWNQHERGELALCYLWNLNQLQSPTGRNIFIHLRTEVLINCLQQRKPIPSMMLKWIAEARRFEDVQETPAGQLADIIVRICAFISFVKNPSSTDALSRYISEVLSIDKELEAWSAKYQNESMTADDLSHNLSMINTCNLCNCARIILHETRHQVLLQRRNLFRLPSSSFHNPILTVSYTAIRNSIRSICSSVPIVQAYFRNKQGGIPAGCGMTLIWPLFVAGTASSATPTERDWISLQLRQIGESNGLQRAKVASLHVANSNHGSHNNGSSS
ncbi:hypothetical protein BO94DRAFT_252030 [Aspergillus sclerotioniger CBS 115572]|uniref:Zn(2)-C6 fungal-type domain-containing protein n=1 Tax=Aspergillus sclerotioniger CBS 115572 TaxID=1450535 RepID=A0A317VCU0_9EURO|nr:hypothetical protein BO94DRAFT_252030 [Aspergillus sclerotioniger CBS 115572]PWY72183.1 hypothetical protein BO94DRAFT_252030 [Aspergillus sclerotioniger CBS 115572]